MNFSGLRSDGALQLLQSGKGPALPWHGAKDAEASRFRRGSEARALLDSAGLPTLEFEAGSGITSGQQDGGLSAPALASFQHILAGRKLANEVEVLFRCLLGVVWHEPSAHIEPGR